MKLRSSSFGRAELNLPFYKNKVSVSHTPGSFNSLDKKFPMPPLTPSLCQIYLVALLLSILGYKELHQVLDVNASGITFLLRSPARSGSLYPQAFFERVQKNDLNHLNVSSAVVLQLSFFDSSQPRFK